MFQIFIGITALSALLSFINAKFVKLPETIGIMILSIITSLLFGLLFFIDSESFLYVCQVIDEIDFRTILFDFLLGVLLFAGAIHVNLKGLLNQKGPVIIYATFGVLLSTFLIGTAFYYIATALG
ncbi:MAG: CPA1 family monovalent cation:H+ antiporter, partial [Maribacter sp.]